MFQVLACDCISCKHSRPATPSSQPCSFSHKPPHQPSTFCLSLSLANSSFFSATPAVMLLQLSNILSLLQKFRFDKQAAASPPARASKALEGQAKATLRSPGTTRGGQSDAEESFQCSQSASIEDADQILRADIQALATAKSVDASSVHEELSLGCPPLVSASIAQIYDMKPNLMISAGNVIIAAS